MRLCGPALIRLIRFLPVALALLSLVGCRGDLGNIFDIY